MNNPYACPFLLVAILLSSPAQALAAQPLSPKERQMIDQAVLEKEGVRIETEATRRTDDALTKVFSARFYDVTIIKHTTSQTTISPATGDTVILARLAGQIVDLKSPSTNEPLPNLQRILNNDFQIKSPQDAFLLEEALDILYPISTAFGNNDLDTKAIQQKGDQWFFIRGLFFDDRKGFVFTTDNHGNITDVSYSLKIPANLPTPPIQPDAEPLTKEEKQAIHAAILKREKIEIETDITRLENDALTNVSSARFYDTTVSKTIGGLTMKRGSMLAILNDQVITLEEPSSHQPVRALQKVLKKDLQLKTQKDAAIIEEALDSLYPIRDEDMKYKAIRQEGSQWMFIRGEFFRDLMGFIFETDEKGNILSVSYSLEIPDSDK